MLAYQHLKDDFNRPFATLCSDGDRCGVAVCHERDQFRKDRGRQIAFGRLMVTQRADAKLPNRYVMFCGEPRNVAEIVNEQADAFIYDLNNPPLLA